MTDTDENIVESDVTGFGNPSLDSDKIDDSTESAIDNLLDEAINGEQANEQPNTIDSGENTENLLDDPVSPVQETKTETQVPVETASAEPQQPVAPVEPKIEIDPEIAAIEQPRNLSEKNQSNWRKLQETASTYKKQAEEAAQLRQKLQELEQGQVQVPQDYEELKKFRQVFDIKNDPEFKSKYSQPIESAKNNIYGILRKHGAAEEVIASIEKAGGPDKINDEFWRNPAFQNLPLTDAEKLKRNLVDVADLRDKQEAEIQYAAENAEKILQEREQEKGQWYQKTVQEIDHTLDEITKDIPWARYVEAPANATPEQIQQVQAHNARVADLATKFESALWPTTAQERTNVAAAAVFSHVVSEQLRAEQTQKNALLEQVKKLTAENNALKSSSKMPKQSSANQSVNKPTSINERISMKSSDAIDLGLDEALGA